MLKKIVFLTSALILSACATNPEGMTSEQFASTATLLKGYDFTQVTGEKIRPINMTDTNGLVVMNATSLLTLKVGEQQNSTVRLDLQFLDNYQRYLFVNVNGENKKFTERQEAVRQCDDQCSVTQYIVFDLKTSELQNAREQGLVFTINKSADSQDFTFKIPANYIDGLFKRYEKENSVVVASAPATATTATTAIPVPAVSAPATNAALSNAGQSQAVNMSQYWFNKLDSEEQVLFSTWAIRNNKKPVQIKAGSKELERLHYWYLEAPENEQQALRVWAVENIK